ncbi:MAG: cation-transporting P-type ATPase, partial [Euryarchaeota archaeon]|nr:cation-transporting P-type ATPase [Euryarchaeota archaeon]
MMDDVFSDKSMQKGKDRSSLLINGATTKVEDLLNELGTSEQGLTEDVVKEHLAKYGSNTYPEKKKNPFMIVWAQFKNLFNILLIMAAALSFISGIMSNAQSSINMGIVILLIVFLSILFNLIQEQRAERAVRSIQQLVPMNAKVMRSGQEKLTPIQDIVPGDIIILEEGDRVPADARVINSFDLSVDNSALTGESDPQPRRSIEESEDEELFQYSNLVFAGTTVVSGTGTVVVILTGEYTQFGSIIGLTRSTKAPPSPLQKDINHAARLNFIVAMLVGLVFLFAAYFILHLDLAASLLFMIGVMVSLVPEGFQIIMTLSLALSSVAMSKRNVVVKRLASVETLGSVTTICTDKTGTITEGQMTARWMWISGDRLKITGEGYEPGGMVFLDEKKLMASDREDLQLMAYASALDNTATLVPPLGHGKSRWTAVGDPTEAALLVMSTKCGVNYKDELKKKKRIGMIPFESSRKMMTSVHEEDEGRYVAYVKGASAELLARSINIYWNGKIIPLTPDIKEQITTQADSFAREAFRVLAIAVRNFSEVPTHFESEKIENQLTFVGLIALYDPPRAETKDAVAKAQHAGIRIIMLTGDHELTAGSIARKVGIISTDDSQVISGHALENMSDENLSLLLDNKELVFARVAPAQKLRIVNLLKSKGETVAVTGDGVNDSPALLGADIGIAMGLTGTDVAKESADMILMDDNFASIVNGVEEGRTVFDNLRKFVVYVFTHNWGELMAFVAFVLLGTPLPLAIIQVLAIDLLMEIPPSLALTTEPPEPGIMLRPPRPKDSRLFNISALSRSMYIGIIVGAYVLFWCFNIWSGGGWSLGSNTVPDHDIYLQGTTAV